MVERDGFEPEIRFPKGLEYPNVILFNLVSGNRAVYADLCRDAVAADLEGDELDYRRAKDKADKSLELNKFYVNALYVAMTRAMEGLALAESDVRHPLLELLGLEEVAEIATGPVQASTRDEWAQAREYLPNHSKDNPMALSVTSVEGTSFRVSWAE